MKYSYPMGVAIGGNLIDPKILATIRAHLPPEVQDGNGLRMVVCCLDDGLGLTAKIDDVTELMELYGKSRKAGISLEDLSDAVDKMLGKPLSQTKNVIPQINLLTTKAPQRKIAPPTKTLTNTNGTHKPTVKVNGTANNGATKPNAVTPIQTTASTVDPSKSTIREASKLYHKMRSQKKGSKYAIEKITLRFPEFAHIPLDKCKALLES